MTVLALKRQFNLGTELYVEFDINAKITYQGNQFKLYIFSIIMKLCVTFFKVNARISDLISLLSLVYFHLLIDDIFCCKRGYQKRKIG